MFKILFGFSVVLFSVAQASAIEEPRGGDIDVKIRPGKSHEICFQGKKGEKIDWSFKSTHAIDFDLHYSNGESSFSPIKESTLFSEKSAFVIDSDQKWCLMWTVSPKNKEASQVSGSWSVGVSVPDENATEAKPPVGK